MPAETNKPRNRWVRDRWESLPALQTLRTGLAAALHGKGCADRRFTVVNRQPNRYVSFSASEVVTCRFDDGSESRVFCKYGVDQQDESGIHRRGVPYEVEVYRRVLEELHPSTPRFYGTYEEEGGGRTWLVLEYLDGCLRVNQTADHRSMKLAARWIGRFHAIGAACLSDASKSILNPYNAEYLAECACRFATIPDHLKESFPWLSELCERRDGIVSPLLTASPTVIHGEFYPSNALIRDEHIYVVDWESAGLGPGEVDLAALTQGPWPEEVVRECEKEYRRARWRENPPPQVNRTLAAARVYFYLWLLYRWSRLRPGLAERKGWIFEQLRSASDRLRSIQDG